MTQTKIGHVQLFCLMFLFELGSAIVVGIGMQAKQDAWITILIGMICAIPIYLIYFTLYLKFPNIPLTSYLPKIIGKFIGIPLSFIYVLYFLYISSRVLRDFGELMITASLDVTPLYAVNGMMIVLVAYAIYHGIEVIGRTSEMVFIIIIILVTLGILFSFLSGLIKLNHLSPIFENGLKPILSTVFKQTFTFPFGEMIVFTMLLPHLSTPKAGLKVGIFAMVASGLILSLTIAIEISILGVNGVATAQFPLLETISKIDIGNIIQRLDVIVLATLVLGMFIKITVFYYAGFTGFVDIFKISNKRYKLFILGILGIIIHIYSIKMADSFTEHIKIGLVWVPVNIHLPLQAGIPVLLFIIFYIQKFVRKNKGNSSVM